MSEDIRNVHGALSWGELMTNDPAAAKAFYSKAFGFETSEMPLESREGETYTCFKAENGKEVLGMMKTPAEMTGMPPMWCMYITVKDVEATAKQVEAAGGSITYPITEIPQVGRFFGFADPQGAAACAIQYSCEF